MRTDKQADRQKPLAVKDRRDDERAFRTFLILSFASLAVFTLIAGLATR
jgi:hypothetical protein